MRRSREGVIDLTPLLDVVFILIFALMMNVQVQVAKEKEAARVEVQALSVTLDEAREDLTAITKERDGLSGHLFEIEGRNADLQDTLEAYAQVMEEQKDQLEALDEAFRDLDIAGVDGVVTSKGTSNYAKSVGQPLAESWLMYNQIAEKFTILDIRLASESGRIYLDDTYTKIDIPLEVLLDPIARAQAGEDLKLYILNELDHKKGGYGFLFVTLHSDREVTRLGVNTLVDALWELQTSFDKDQYSVSRYVFYD